jgi:hypothetical protein
MAPPDKIRETTYGIEPIHVLTAKTRRSRSEEIRITTNEPLIANTQNVWSNGLISR